MIYKVMVDAEKALDALNKLGVRNSVKKVMHLFVDAENPDSACHEAIEKLMDNIIKEKLSDEIVDFLEDELTHNVRVIELTRVRPYA
jgi:predicted house-cleaning noncanonical NTP pyrophosphatase (MazG superfamily)